MGRMTQSPFYLQICQIFTNFKNSFISRLSDKCVEKSYSSFLKCLATLPCDLSLITIHISDWRHFSDIHISQGSLAKRFRSNGIFIHNFVANLPLRLSAKEFRKSVIIW